MKIEGFTKIEQAEFVMDSFKGKNKLTGQTFEEGVVFAIEWMLGITSNEDMEQTLEDIME